MNKTYLRKLFTLIDEEDRKSFELKNANDLEDYIEETICSNAMYDFNIDIDFKKLFN